MIIDLVYEHFNADEASAYFLTSNNILCSRADYRELGGFDTSFPRAGAEDRDFCDRWRASGRPLRMAPTATIEHRHAQNLSQFLGLHYRYGRGAYVYQAKRRRRGSGSMAQDMNFHISLLRRHFVDAAQHGQRNPAQRGDRRGRGHARQENPADHPVRVGRACKGRNDRRLIIQRKRDARSKARRMHRRHLAGAQGIPGGVPE
jgi:GT2 family glycosyltransferase